MLWIIFALGAALAWGLYGPILHQGQVELGSPLRALLCVGATPAITLCAALSSRRGGAV